MTTSRIVVLGGNFAGLTAALELKHALGEDVQVLVVSASDRFVFTPSLIWLAFGDRSAGDLSFPLAPTLDAHRIEFLNAAATAIDPEARIVLAGGQILDYDQLVLATGFRNDFSVAPGLGPDGYTQTITTLAGAEAAAWLKFLDDPGPVVVATTQGASCRGAAYEFLFNLSHRLRKAGLQEEVPLTFLTAEPALADLPGGKGSLEQQGIEFRTGVALAEAGADRLVLTDDSEFPFRYAMVIPPFLGQEVVRAVPGLADARGFVPVDRWYRADSDSCIHAVGTAAAVPIPWHTAVPAGIPKTGFPVERMARTAAAAIVADLRGIPRPKPDGFGERPALGLLDTGDRGIMLLSDHMMLPRRAGVTVRGPQVHAIKVGLEKYYLWKTRHGYVRLP